MHAILVKCDFFVVVEKVRVMFIWVYCNSQYCFNIVLRILYCYLKMGTQPCQVKVSATLQDRPRADRCSVSCFYKNPYKPYSRFKSLIIPDYGFELTKTIYSNVFRNWNVFCKSTRLYKSCSTPAGNKRKKTINTAFASQHVPLKNRVSDF